MKSLLLGIDHALPNDADFAEKVPIEVLPYEEALQYMQSRLPMSKEEYYSLDDKMRYRAFTVSRLHDADAIDQVKGFLVKGLKEGEDSLTLASFRKMTNEELLDATGIGKTSGWYWETVYRTNVQTVYNTGRAIGFSAVHPIALELIGVEDSRQTEFCRSVTVPPFRRPYNDPVWETMWPPFHFSCRTTVRGIYDEKEISEEGGSERFYSLQDPDMPEKGWGANPLDGTAWWEMTDDMKRRAVKAKIDKEIDEAKKLLVHRPKQIVYREAKTIAEANKFARKDLGLAGSSYSGCHIEAANEWNLSLAKNLNDFPEVEGLHYVGSFSEARKIYTKEVVPKIVEDLKKDYQNIPVEQLEQAAKKLAKRNSLVLYNSNNHGLTFFGDIDKLKGIALNDRLAANPELHRAMRSREVKDKFKVIGGDKIGAIADHEFGHVLDRWLDISDDKEIKSMYADIVTNQGKDRLSGYGIRNVNEMIAESWAEIRNNPAPREIASRVAAVIQRRYEEWKKLNS